MKTQKPKKPIFKQWWFWAIIVCLIVGLISPNKEPAEAAPTISTEPATEATTLPPTEAPTEAATEAVPNQFDGYIEKPLTEFVAKVEELEYNAIYLDHMGTDITDGIEWIAEAYVVWELEEDPAAKTVSVGVRSISSIEQEKMEEALKEKLETGSAWIAAEKHGEAEYGDFELHYFLGQIAIYAEDENTWHLKAECTLFGNDMICEAKVTGTSDDPEVIYFEVY